MFLYDLNQELTGCSLQLGIAAGFKKRVRKTTKIKTLFAFKGLYERLKGQFDLFVL